MVIVEKSKALKRLERALNELHELKNSIMAPPGLGVWHRNTRLVIESVFGKDSSHVREFMQISFDPIVVKLQHSTASAPGFPAGFSKIDRAIAINDSRS